jgi:hypothetical protein
MACRKCGSNDFDNAQIFKESQVSMHLACYIAIVLALIVGYQIRKLTAWRNLGIHLVQKVRCFHCGEPGFDRQFTPDGYPFCVGCKNEGKIG